MNYLALKLYHRSVL